MTAARSKESPRALVVNCSGRHYNLGAAKLADWLRSQDYEVSEAADDPGLFALGFDVVALSVIFSWHAPIARDIALRVRGHSEVWCGGPGMFALARQGWWKRETGLDCHVGLDERFERQQGDYPFTFASRGCSVGCGFCIVPLLEGRTPTPDYNFRPAPVLCDNNLSGLPFDFQQHILERYVDLGLELKDCNSGFEPMSFTDDTYALWRGMFKGPWRFAFDESKEFVDVARMMRVLRRESARKKQVYVLIGNEPVEACYERACQVIAAGGEPYVQARMRLNTLSRDDLWLSDDWTPTLARDFQRYYNRHLWRSLRIADYKPRVNEPRPFAHVTRRPHHRWLRRMDSLRIARAYAPSTQAVS